MIPNIKAIVIADNRQIFGLGEDNKIYRWDYATAAFMAYWNHPGQDSPDQTKKASIAPDNHQQQATPHQ